MAVIQLKASDSFIQLVSEVKKVKGIILCEGLREAETLKILAKRLSLVGELEGFAITDSEGINTLRSALLPALLALIIGKVVSKPKPVVLVVDADRFKPEERVKWLRDSLASRGYRALESRQICSAVWLLKVQRNYEEIPLLIAVNGVFSEPFTSIEIHELEDHVVYLKLLEGHLTEEDIRRVKKAAELVADRDYELFNSASREHVEEAFKHYVCLLKALSHSEDLA